MTCENACNMKMKIVINVMNNDDIDHDDGVEPEDGLGQTEGVTCENTCNVLLS